MPTNYFECNAALDGPICPVCNPRNQGPRIVELEAFVARIAALAPEQHWSDDAFAPEPPEWARYEGFGMHGDQCCRCGAWCSIVRPGKTQCDVCCDDNMTALAIEAKRLVETQS